MRRVFDLCRTQFPEQEIRLQMCLATPLLNSDLVEKRLRLHFARAAAGETPGTWVLPLYGGHTTRAPEPRFGVQWSTSM